MNLGSDELQDALAAYGSEDEMEDTVQHGCSQELFSTRSERVFPKLAMPLDDPELMGHKYGANQPKSGTALQVSQDDESDEDILAKSREGEDFLLRMFRLHVKMLKW